MSGKNQALFLNILTSKICFHVILYHKTRYNAFTSRLLISLYLLFVLESASACFFLPPQKNAGTSGSDTVPLVASFCKANRLISWIEEIQEGSNGSFGGMIHSTSCWRSLHHSSSCSMPSLPFSLVGALMAPRYIPGHLVPPDCSAHSWMLRTLLRHSAFLWLLGALPAAWISNRFLFLPSPVVIPIPQRPM